MAADHVPVSPPSAECTSARFYRHFGEIHRGRTAAERGAVFDHAARDILAAARDIGHFRRIYWGAFLGAFDCTLSFPELCESLKHNRREYHEKLERLQHVSLKNLSALDPQVFHPLSSSSQHNPWVAQQETEELKESIWKDIQRTFPERPLFQDNDVRLCLQRILLVWAKENASVSYKQGMNELAGLLYLAVFRDQSFTGDESDSVLPQEFLDGETAEQKSNRGANASRNSDADKSEWKAAYEMLCTGSERDIEADTYILFSKLMDNAGVRELYACDASGGGSGQLSSSPVCSPVVVTSSSASPTGQAVAHSRRSHIPGAKCLLSQHGSSPSVPVEPDAVFGNRGARAQRPVVPATPVLTMCANVFELLASVDPALHRHLQKAEMEPQIFFLRWLRLIFIREFHVEQSLTIWDSFLSDVFLRLRRVTSHSRLSFLEYFAISMLEHVKRSLLSVSGMECIRLCLNYPRVECARPLIRLALRLRDDPEGGVVAIESSLRQKEVKKVWSAAEITTGDAASRVSISARSKAALTRDVTASPGGVGVPLRLGDERKDRKEQHSPLLTASAASRWTAAGIPIHGRRDGECDYETVEATKTIVTRQRVPATVPDGSTSSGLGDGWDEEESVPQLLDLSAVKMMAGVSQWQSSGQQTQKNAAHAQEVAAEKLNNVIEGLSRWVTRCKLRSKKLSGGGIVPKLSGRPADVLMEEKIFLDHLTTSLENATSALEDVLLSVEPRPSSENGEVSCQSRPSVSSVVSGTPDCKKTHQVPVFEL